jgi:nitric oxide reductase large subunit
MLVSSLFTNHAVKNYNKENYVGSVNAQSALMTLIVAVVILVIEIALLYYAISIALVSSSTNEGKFINIVLAVTFTMPYLLLNLLFNPAAKTVLGEGQLPAYKFSCGMY